jgi:hypothetical protein
MSELTNAQIDRMTAEKVMGWEMEKNWHGEYWTEFARPTMYKSYCSHWKPSINLNQAWQVVEKLDCEVALFKERNSKICKVIIHNTKCVAENVSPARAICLAALQVVEAE